MFLLVLQTCLPGSAIVLPQGSIFQHLWQHLHFFLQDLIDGSPGLAQHILVISVLSLLLTSSYCLQLSPFLTCLLPVSTFLSESPSEKRECVLPGPLATSCFGLYAQQCWSCNYVPGADVGRDRRIRYISNLGRCHKYSRFSPIVRIRRLFQFKVLKM